MSNAESASGHYLQIHGLYARPPEALNDALKAAIGELDLVVSGSSRTELTSEEIAILERGGADVDDYPELEDPMGRYAVEFAAIIERSLTTDEIAEILGLTAVRIRQLIAKHQLYAFRIESRWRVPTFQIDNARLVPNIAGINPALFDLDPVSVLRWYTSKDSELQDADGRTMTPLEWLKAGRDAATLVKIAPGT